tara:strand:+ start:859 stop:1974 length:1116 start_codon:yes stop_codon:yes gene_type:complete
MICNNCVMDTTDSQIIFDENGVCDHCNTFYSKIEPYWNDGRDGGKEISKLVSKIQNNKNEFNCIIGMSGGIDSSYLLHIMVSKYKLKPLVFHVDAGWNSELAVNNINKIVNKLKLDLYTEVINWKEMKDLQLSYFKSGVSNIDTPQDHAFFATMYKFALKNNIKYILTGGNYSTECIRNPLEWMWYQSDSIQLKDIHKKYGNIALNNFPITNILWHKFYLPYIKNIKLIRPLDLISYRKENALKELENIYGYKKYPQKHFESRFTKFYESYWLYERFGYDTRKVQLSSLILTGQISRKEALKILEKKPYDEKNIHHDFQYVCTKLGIEKLDLENYFKMEKRTYKDFKSQEKIFNFGAYLLKKLGIEKGGKR